MDAKRKMLLLVAGAHITAIAQSFAKVTLALDEAVVKKLDAQAIAVQSASALAPGCSNDMAALPPGPCVITEADLRPVGGYYPPDYKQHVANALDTRPRFAGYYQARASRRRKW